MNMRGYDAMNDREPEKVNETLTPEKPEVPEPSLTAEPTEAGNQLVIPGCAKDRTRGPAQGDLF